MLCPGGGSGPSGSDGVAMPSEWSNDELSSEGDRDPAAELRELEDELCRLSGVHAVRIVGDRSGRPIEVHVLADPSKPAKQTVRDVRAVAQTVFGIELDHRIVSVAQLNTNDQNTPVGIELPRAEVARARRLHQHRGGRPARRGARRARRERPRAHRLRRRFGRERGATAARRRRRARRGASGRAGGRGDPHHQRGDQPHRQQPRRHRHRRLRRSAHRARRLRVRRSCAAIATTPSPARCSTPPTVVSPAPNAVARPG